MTRRSSRRAKGVLVLIAGPAVLFLLGLLAERAPSFLDLRYDLQRRPEDAPSSRAVPPGEAARGLPLLSLYTETENLFDPRSGLLTHVSKHGRAWERPAYLSYFDEGRLLFVSGVGIRIHGAQSRMETPVKSLRIYFRRKSYAGIDHFQPGLLFGGSSADPLKRVIARNDLRQDPDGIWWHFTDPLAHDIARRVGCLTPETKPVRFFLNGQFVGVFVMTEWLKDGYFESHYPGASLEFAGTNKEAQLRGWFGRSRPLTMKNVGKVIDVESLTRWWIAVVFCATYDVYQGPLLRIRAPGQGRWFWINWDMDHSFFRNPKERSRIAWKQDPFDIIAKQPHLRGDLFRHLIEDDPSYREYAKRLFTQALNHELTPGFLESRYEHYRRIGEEYGVSDREYLGPLKAFLEKRPAQVRAILEERLNTGPPRLCRVEGPAGLVLEIDGFPEKAGYSGWYFEGMEVDVTVPPESRNSFVQWKVNGEKVDGAGGTLRHRVESDTTIEAVFQAEGAQRG